MLAKQIITDQQGIPMGVFIPIQSWDSLILEYPDIERIDSNIPQQVVLQPDDDLRRAITAEELKKRMRVSISNFFAETKITTQYT